MRALKFNFYDEEGRYLAEKRTGQIRGRTNIETRRSNAHFYRMKSPADRVKAKLRKNKVNPKKERVGQYFGPFIIILQAKMTRIEA